MQMASTMSEPTVFSVELLLDIIKQYPVLYDKSHPRYKEADYKKEIWKKISQDLGVTDGIYQAKFKNLKDNFTKTKAKIRDKMKSGAGAKDVPTVKWKHFEALIPIMEKVYEEPISDKSAESGSRSQEDSQLELSLNEIHEVGWVDFETGSSSHGTPSSDTSETPQQTNAQEPEVGAPNRRQGTCCGMRCVEIVGGIYNNFNLSAVHQGHESIEGLQEARRLLATMTLGHWLWQLSVLAT
ncbi:uncharacterized protein LOC142573258 [Dermacentor variabilis]|uniref:uncharacterized protein LOC142573258 n=1 Tax=Dermacentor variabilis TaxID=34621 RepID=UPI003F5AEDA4